ncbi:MAG: hypothetical protein DRP89_00065 [Candidatus Neomarinimicrobiota bacterium]|nr:MAG: hypothetical protein DRP89_00065 [Candidatus Neomarinimicrobiota bacterium]
MKTYLDCMPCVVKFALSAIRKVTDSEEIQEKIMREVLHEVSRIDFTLSPPEISHIVFRYIKEYFGDVDPYLEEKKRFNKFCLTLLPQLRERVVKSKNPFDTAIRMSIAGNIIDSGANTNVNERDILDTIEECMSVNLYTNEGVFALYEEIRSAKNILILGDNAGEIVFDQLLIDQVPKEIVTYVVKSAPILNDATMEDAVETGLTKIVKVIGNGSDSPGTILDRCSPEFIEKFNEADVVIGKGQANYETLSDVDRAIFFILKIKCPVIARDMGYSDGNCIVIKKNKWESLYGEKCLKEVS